MRLIVLAIGLFFSNLGLHAKTLYSWSQPTGNIISFRVIVDDAQCPSLLINDKNTPMNLWYSRTNQFPITMCQINLNKSDQATLNGAIVPTIHDPKKILVIGDTGCGSIATTKDQRGYQDCSRDNSWPFPKLIRNAERLKPDLIIHVGDMHYRKLQCKHKLSNCYGDYEGTGYGSWKADFFEPMANLLKIAPIILVKGNHENCHRAGDGWNILFSANSNKSVCTDEVEEAQLVSFNDIEFTLLDNSSAKDAIAQDVNFYHNYIKKSLKLLSKNNHKVRVLLSHKPVYSSGYSVPDMKINKFYNLTLFEAMKGIDASRVDFSLHGHLHQLNISKFFDKTIPTQVIVGNSGGLLWADSLEHSGFAGGPLPKLSVSYHDFGFAMINISDSDVVLDYFDVEGNKVGSDILLQRKS